MSTEEELNKIKKEKIIMQAKLKQKEDKITELNQKIRELSIASKNSGSVKDLEEKSKNLEEELKRSRKNNNDLRTENAKLTKELEKAKKAKASAPKIEKVSLSEESEVKVSPADIEKLEFFKAKLEKKDQIISRLSEQLNMFSPEQISQISGSYMKTRQLNAKIRELKSQLELAKKSENSMRQRLDEMQRKMALKDEELSW